MHSYTYTLLCILYINAIIGITNECSYHLLTLFKKKRVNRYNAVM